jgi:DNA/RNA-binding domain of Phe-tRNA-synthetase-like protein
MAIKSAYRQQITYPAKADAQEKTNFPSVRYFQIHFEYMETQMNETRCSMEAMQTQMADLYSQVALLTAELTKVKGD